MNERLKNFWASGSIAAAAFFGAVSPAQAVVYVGNWDPAFGPIFPNLGFKGTATFSLPAACENLSGNFLNSAPGCGGGAVQILSASVSFYNLASPATTLQVLNFTSPGAVISVDLATPVGTAFIPTQLTGVTTDFSTGVLGTIAESKFGSNAYKFYLGFSGTTTTLAYTLDNFGSLDCSRSKPNDETCGFSTVSPEVTFKRLAAPIPEPETYALMLAGLGVMAWVARRRRSR